MDIFTGRGHYSAFHRGKFIFPVFHEDKFEAWNFICLFIHRHILSVLCISLITIEIKMNKTIS